MRGRLSRPHVESSGRDARIPLTFPSHFTIPTMSDECLIAEFRDQQSFHNALEVLEKSDYPTDQISVITSADEVEGSRADDAVDTSTSSPPTEKTTAASTVTGGTLGAVLGTATMVGPMLIAGPIIGMAAGAVGGSLLSTVESWGVQKDVGDQYEARVRKGAKLILLSGDSVRLDRGQRMLKTCGPASMDRFKA